MLSGAVAVAMALLGLPAAEGPLQRFEVRYLEDAHPRKHKMDVFVPAGSKAAPLVVFFHGGVWQAGDKDAYENVGRALAEHGLVAAVVNYRLTPEVKHPGHVQDAAAAVAYAREHAAQWGADPARVWLAGHSAGGHLVTLLLMEPRWLQAVGVNAEGLGGVVPMSGVFDLQQPLSSRGDGGFRSFVHPVFGRDARALAAASPVTHVRKTAVPVHVAALERAGVTHALHRVEDRGHFDLVQAMDADDITTRTLVDIIGRAAP